MEGQSHDRALPNRHHRSRPTSQDLDPLAHPDNLGCTNEGDMGTTQLGVEVDLRRVDLGTEGISSDIDVEHPERLLARCRIEDSARQQDQTGAGAQGRQASGDDGAQRIDQLEDPQQSVDRG